jgi:exodeoxyribonuclease VII small subunit
MPSRSKEDPDIPEPLPLEALTARIAAILDDLESGNLPLNEAVSAYTEGMAAIKSAQQRLLEAEQRVRQFEIDSDEDDYQAPEG